MLKYSVLLDEKHSAGEQIEICRKFGFSNLEITESFNGAHFLDLKNEDIIKDMYGNKVFMSMLNVKAYNGEFDLPYLKKLVKKCSSLGLEYINILGLKQFDYNAMDVMLKFSKMHNIGVCIENGFGSAFDGSRQFVDLAGVIDCKELGVVFNPLEFSKNKEHPFLNIFYKAKFKNNIKVLRINDGLFTDAVPKLPGDGNCEIKELLSALKSRSFNGYISFIPYFANQTLYDYEAIYKAFAKLAARM